MHYLVVGIQRCGADLCTIFGDYANGSKSPQSSFVSCFGVPFDQDGCAGFDGTSGALIAAGDANSGAADMAMGGPPIGVSDGVDIFVSGVAVSEML